jgi:osmoprotectant transport system ATP-binding protein
MFAFEHVSKRFGESLALDDVTFACAPGETTVLIGSSGSGKSTLLRMMVALARPDAGSLRFDGRDLCELDPIEVRHRVGYVIQEGGLFPHLDTTSNVALLARQLGRDEGWAAARIAELRELVQLPRESLAKFPAQLSGGQRQRVALMRALMLDPEVLLLDEPLGALDPIIRAELRAELCEIFAECGKTVVFVTHDLREASALGGTAVLLDEGRIVQRGSMQQLVEAPASEFVERFVEAQELGVGRG